MSASEVVPLPEALRRDIDRRAQILKAVGCTGVFLVGSAAQRQFHEGTALALAVIGCPCARFDRVPAGEIIASTEPDEAIRTAMYTALSLNT